MCTLHFRCPCLAARQPPPLHPSCASLLTKVLLRQLCALYMSARGQEYMKRRPPVKHLYDGSLETFQPYPPLRKHDPLDEVEETWAMVQVCVLCLYLVVSMHALLPLACLLCGGNDLFLQHVWQLRNHKMRRGATHQEVATARARARTCTYPRGARTHAGASRKSMAAT